MSDPQPSGAFHWTQEPWGRALQCALLSAPHLFTSRDVTLTDDDGEWDAVAASMGVTPDRLLLVRQVHGTAVAVARRDLRTLPPEGGSHAARVGSDGAPGGSHAAPGGSDAAPEGGSHATRVGSDGAPGGSDGAPGGSDAAFERGSDATAVGSHATRVGSHAARWSTPAADIIITDDPDVAIGVRVADCAPILLYDSTRHVAGAVHAGWRGTAAGAAAAGVQALRREFGADPRDIVAAIGPCLAGCCGEVGPDVLDAFRSGDADDVEIARWFRPGRGDRSLLDLPGANRDQLAAAGVPVGQIFDSGLCTKTHHQRLHSYRAERTSAGRMLAAIRIAR